MIGALGAFGLNALPGETIEPRQESKTPARREQNDDKPVLLPTLGIDFVADRGADAAIETMTEAEQQRKEAAAKREEDERERIEQLERAKEFALRMHHQGDRQEEDSSPKALPQTPTSEQEEVQPSLNVIA